MTASEWFRNTPESRRMLSEERARLDSEETRPVVIVDRISPLGIKPDYCIHGESFCVSCNQAVWLGDKTVDMVVQRLAMPLCLTCATAMKEMGLMPDRPSEHVHDHRRADGPHE